MAEAATPQKKARQAKKPVEQAEPAAAPAKKKATKKAAAAAAPAPEPAAAPAPAPAPTGVAAEAAPKKRASTKKAKVVVPEAVAQVPVAAGAAVEKPNKKKKKKKSRSTAAQNRRARKRIENEAQQTGPAIRETSFRKLLREIIATEQQKIMPLGPKGEPRSVRLSTKAQRNIHGMVEAQLVRALTVPAYLMYEGNHKTFKFKHLQVGAQGVQLTRGLHLDLAVPERDDVPAAAGAKKPATPAQGRDDMDVA